MMKLLFSITVFSLAILFSSCSTQDIPASKVPSVVLNTVVEKYPATNEVDWKKANKQYEAEVKLNDSTDITFLIDDAGRILKQKEDIDRAGIPTPILTVITNAYAGYGIDDAEKLTIGNTIYYQFELDGSGKKDVNLVFTAEGAVSNEIKYWD